VNLFLRSFPPLMAPPLRLLCVRYPNGFSHSFKPEGRRGLVVLTEVLPRRPTRKKLPSVLDPRPFKPSASFPPRPRVQRGDLILSLLSYYGLIYTRDRMLRVLATPTYTCLISIPTPLFHGKSISWSQPRYNLALPSGRRRSFINGMSRKFSHL